MDVLRKHKVAQRDNCIRLTLTAGGVVEFKFSDADAPWTPASGCNKRIYAVDERTTDAVEDWLAAADAFKKAMEQKRDDYRALIDGSTYLEEIESVWPGASVIRQRIVLNLPATLTEDAVARIRADHAKAA
jgi:hypothetical protein